MGSPEDEVREGEDGGTTTSAGLADLLERTLLLGIGAAAITKDRVQAVVDDFVRRGQLSREEGREVVDNIAERSREEARSARRRIDSSLQTTYREMGLATRKDMEDLDFRLRQVEHRLGLLEREADASPGPGEDVS
jgi:polyhydroxyalkanoate synthesis regulator phasin